VGGERLEVGVVQRSVGVLLRVGDPDHEVDDLHEAVDLGAVAGLDRVEVGQVEHDERVVAGAPRRWRSGTSSQSSSGSGTSP
jgi:hypothetical protein